MKRLVGTIAVLLMLGQASGGAQFRGFGFGGVQPDVQLVDQFDADGNGRLDVEERQDARTWLRQAGPRGRRRGFGGFGRRGAPARPVPGKALTPDDVEIYPSADLYDRSILRTIFLEFENDDWEQELADFKDTDVEVPARVTVDGRVYDDVGVHFRGQSSFMMVPEGLKRSLNLSFNFVDKDQRLHGYRTLNLLNAANDPTLLRTTLYGEIGRHYLPIPKVNYARVVINGENWGVYLNAQQFNSDFTRDWFESRKGARWKVPGSPRGAAGMDYRGDAIDPYRNRYEIKTKDDEESWTDLIAMFRVLGETPLEELEDALAPVLDVDGVLRFLALEVALVNSDGYWTRASDYSIYQDTSGQFHVVPHDFNEAMGGEGGFMMRGGGGTTLGPLVGLNDRGKPLRSRLLAVPALRARYLTYVRDIGNRWLDWETLGPIARQYQALIAEDVQRDTRKLYNYQSFETGLDAVRSFADRRRTFLAR